MDKEIIKMLLTLMIIVSYFMNLLVMFCYNAIDILLANVGVWLIIILIILGFKFVDWLND